jgi:enoyl-CoA hydratase/carnithine racemase
MSHSVERGDRLDVDVTGPIATVSITNVAKRNVMSAAMWRALPGLLDRLEADPRVKVLVLRGAGETFCAGADIADLDALGTTGEDTLATRAEERLAAFPKPVIAQLSGYCVGGGCQLAVACDLRFAAAGTRLGITPARLGIVYPASSTRRLVELVGPSAAKYLLYSAELIDAARAAAVGLVDEVVPDAELAARVRAFADVIAGRSQLSVAASKEIVGMASRGAVDPARVADWHRVASEASDTVEGVAAFRERRTPRFTWSPTGAPAPASPRPSAGSTSP